MANSSTFRVTIYVNGNEMRYVYDAAGRNTALLAPYEIDSGRPYTIKMDYYPKNYGQTGIFGNAGQSYARTSHHDPQHPADDITTTVLTDGLGRLLQTKKDAEINGREWSIVSGKVKYDCFGRTVEQYHPFTEDTALYPSYNPYHDPATLTRTEYDVMDRQTYMELPTHEATTVHYGFGSWGGKTLFSTLTTDALSNSIQVLKGTMGQQIKQTAPYNTETLFEYDCLGQLKKSTDPDGFETAYEYDLFGQVTHRHHPDAGHDYYAYDPSGNMVKHTNGMGDTLNYEYRYNQLQNITCSSYPANNVHYEYGTPYHAGINAVGKVIMQEDASGWQKFEYGKLGEVTKNMRTFALPFENEPYTFAMEYGYDSYNRIQRMTYPDGEVVSYHYNYGGLLDRMEGTKGNYTYQYIDSIRYNEFEKRDAVYYGNGASIFYKYDILQRLSNIHSRTNFNEPLQNITYTYDSVGNITNILNDAGVLANGLGGQYEYQYQYDRLYRLGSSYGEWHGGPGMDYELHMDYTLNGRIASKSLVGATYIQDPYASTFIPFHYDNHYHYNNTSQPNTLSHIDNGPYQYFEWDTKGNMVFHHNDQTGFDRRLCWDEENRLQGVLDNQYLSLYQYDANGERTYKLAGWNALQNRNGSWRNYYLLDHATLYASPYLVATPQGYTKHYYAESERIASKIGGGELNSLTLNIVGDPDFFEKIAKNRTHAQKVAQDCLSAGEIGTPSVMWPLFEWKNCIEADEKDCYWYHPDHLGSSSWITYSDGKAVQHLQYMPWGEDFVNQRITDYAARYTFSAKEKDPETGYSYFGSRYYSSDLSIWLSVDPMSDKYPSLSPYTYCANNPIKLVDPDGEEIVDENGVKCYDEKKGWLDNAPEDTKRIGNAMMQTKTGRAQFEKLVQTDTKVKMQISSENKNNKKECIMGESIYNNSDILKDNKGNYHLKEATMIIYEKSISSYLNGSGDVNATSMANNVGYGDSERFAQAIFSGGVSVEDYIGAVAGHEAEHITSPSNILLQINKRGKEAEVIPMHIETRILLESNFK